MTKPDNPRLWSGSGLRLLLSILIVTLNLRGAITCVGPLLQQIQADYDLSATAAGLLTSLPLIAFACISPYAAALARRIGIERAIFLSLLVFIAGLGVRYMPGSFFLYLGTGLIGTGIAISNVLVPGLLRRDFPQHLATVTALFTMVMVTAGGLGSGIAIPLADWGGWRVSLVAWLLPALFALLVWTPRLKFKKAVAQTQPVSARKISMWTNSLAWQVSMFMALQSSAFYVMIAWLPLMLSDLEGISAEQSGWILFVYQIFALLSLLATTYPMRILRDQRWIGVVCSILILIGYVGLLVAAHQAMLWMILMGLGAGGSLVLAMTLFGLRVKTAAQSVSLSGMAQSIAYALAAFMPIFVGYIYDHTHSWSVPLVLMIVFSVLQIGAGYLAGRPLVISEHGVAEHNPVPS